MHSREESLCRRDALSYEATVKQFFVDGGLLLVLFCFSIKTLTEKCLG